MIVPLLDLERETDEEWAAWCEKYREEMCAPEPSHILDLLALLSEQADFSVGCYCDTERRCHRSVLRRLFEDRGVNVI